MAGSHLELKIRKCSCTSPKHEKYFTKFLYIFFKILINSPNCFFFFGQIYNQITTCFFKMNNKATTTQQNQQKTKTEYKSQSNNPPSSSSSFPSVPPTFKDLCCFVSFLLFFFLFPSPTACFHLQVSEATSIIVKILHFSLIFFCYTSLYLNIHYKELKIFFFSYVL